MIFYLIYIYLIYIKFQNYIYIYIIYIIIYNNIYIFVRLNSLTHLTFTCSKSTTEALEKGVKYVQS